MDVYLCEDWLAKVRGIEAKLREGLEPLRALQGVRDVRVLGAIGVVEVDRAADNTILAPAFVREGVWVRPFGNIFYLMPPFVIGDDELDKLLAGFVSGTKRWVSKTL